MSEEKINPAELFANLDLTDLSKFGELGMFGEREQANLEGFVYRSTLEIDPSERNRMQGKIIQAVRQAVAYSLGISQVKEDINPLAKLDAATGYGEALISSYFETIKSGALSKKPKEEPSED